MYNIENGGGGIKMSNKIFTEKEIKKLSHNKNIKTISINGIKDCGMIDYELKIILEKIGSEDIC